MRKTISDQCFKEDRALDYLSEADIISCHFESEYEEAMSLYMAQDVRIRDCRFSSKYVLWNSDNFTLEKSSADEKCRSGIWYSIKGVINECDWKGAKGLRECRDIEINNSRIDSVEFGWKSRGVVMKDGVIDSTYLFLGARDVELKNMKINGDYALQYVENLTISDTELDTKDGLWHSRNVTVKDSVLKGKYIGWVTEGLTLINCHIESYVPFCNCRGLKLVNCTMGDSEECFMFSDVEAAIKGHINSYYEPFSGSVSCDSAGRIIKEDRVLNSSIFFSGS